MSCFFLTGYLSAIIIINKYVPIFEGMSPNRDFIPGFGSMGLVFLGSSSFGGSFDSSFWGGLDY